MIEGKPLGRKSYGSIGHLPGSRLGVGDHHIDARQAHCLTEALPKGDRLVVQEKLDGSNVGVCKVNDVIIPLVRAGWDAHTSPRLMHRMFAYWAMERQDLFREILSEGERVCGEWLALAHGTRYQLPHDPFVAFDLFTADDERLTLDAFRERIGGRFTMPHVFHDASQAYPLALIADLESHHGAMEPMEGVVYRWERTEKRSGVTNTRVLMLAKYVKQDKVDGCYLGDDVPPIWNWLPETGPRP